MIFLKIIILIMWIRNLKMCVKRGGAPARNVTSYEFLAVKSMII